MRNLNTAVAMTTGKKLLRGTLGVAALICAASMPGYCATAFLSYTAGWGTLTGAQNITLNFTGSNETLSSFTVPVVQLTVSNAIDTADNGQWAITGGTEVYALSGSTVTITVDGTIGACTGCVGTSNLTGVGGPTTALTTITYTGLSGGIPFNAGLTGTSFDTSGTTKTNFALVLGAASSLTDLPLLLSDLGESATTGTVNSGGVNGTGPGGYR